MSTYSVNSLLPHLDGIGPYIYIYIYIYITVRDGGNPTKMAVATNIMQVMNIKLKLLVIESKIEHLQ